MHLGCYLLTLAFLSDILFLHKLYQTYFGLFHYFLKPPNFSSVQNRACQHLRFLAGICNLSAYASWMTVPDDLDVFISNCHSEPQTLLNINIWLQWVSNSALLPMQSNDSCWPITQTIHNLLSTQSEPTFFFPFQGTVQLKMAFGQPGTCIYLHSSS